MDVSSGKLLAESLDAAVLPDNPYFNTMLRILTTRCMMQAVYFCSGTLAPNDYYHYGLATPIYTHFTSPIRRYECDGEEFVFNYCSKVYIQTNGGRVVRWLVGLINHLQLVTEEEDFTQIGSVKWELIVFAALFPD